VLGAAGLGRDPGGVGEPPVHGEPLTLGDDRRPGGVGEGAAVGALGPVGVGDRERPKVFGREHFAAAGPDAAGVQVSGDGPQAVAALEPVEQVPHDGGLDGLDLLAV
jgi:hypothetical protein